MSLPRCAPASTEEFSSFTCEGQDEDDESLLDHFQTRYPPGWEREWSRGGQQFRTSQGCLTSGQWLVETQLQLTAPVGRTMRFGFDLRQRLSDDWTVEYYDLTWRRLVGQSGYVGWLLRPFHDKSLQDMGPFWSFGPDSGGLRVQGTFILEDTFNNLWAFRQRRVGDRSEPYLKRPYEPTLRLQWSRAPARIAARGTWLTPATKRIESGVSGAPAVSSLWGADAGLNLEVATPAQRWTLDCWNKQVRSSLGPDGAPAANADYRRQWRLETSLARRLGRRVELTGTFLYGERFQHYTPSPEPRLFAAVDRMADLKADVVLGPRLTATTGLTRARIQVDQEGSLAGRVVSPGTRHETRAHVGLQARFGNLLVAATEGLELDHEPYEVWLIHDKAFFQLMARF